MTFGTTVHTLVPVKGLRSPTNSVKALRHGLLTSVIDINISLSNNISRQTRRIAIANGTCVSFCNQSKAHFGLPWVRPWDNRGKCYMDGKMLVKRIASIFSCFPVIQSRSSKVRHCSTFFAHFSLSWLCPWDNRGKCYMDRKRIQCLSNASQRVHILSSTVYEL